MPDEPMIRVGCPAIPPGVSPAKYMAALDYLELADTFYRVPGEAALRKRARGAPDGFGFGIVAWQVITHRPGPRGYPRLGDALDAAALAQAGGLRDTPVVRDAVAQVAAAAAVVGAETVVFRTPDDMSPSEANRDLLRRFFSELAPAETFAGAVRVWEPGGLWQPQAAQTLADELDVVLAFDPLESDPTLDIPPPLPEAERSYFRIRGLGATGALAVDKLEELADACLGRQRVWAVFATPERGHDASRFRQLVTSAG